MPVIKTETLPVQTDQDIVLVRQTVRKLSQQAAFSLVDQTKFVTAASELARNTVIYGGGGTMQWETFTEGVRNCVRLTFVDQGPGIANLELALTDGWTSGRGMGMGLSGSKRLVNEFDIQSAPGKGTRVMIARWK
ncbi:anti-sigma regulatory factor [Anatilimnocola floriformis]|uniref:anti-sigma regulatory factor n=1 Tax=Anatilimnocola floriformis TaxID=2948575 RepID=UPI0020C2334E|nr:anti-sigma regulatory factor [Anatilimnocola floriformis]